MPVFLDHHSTTPVDARVLELMWPYFREKFGNSASTNHVFGWRAAEAVEAARQQVAQLLNTDPAAVVFTSGATEANNLALKGVLHRAPAESHVIATAVEHRAVLDPLRRLKRQGYGVTIVPVDGVGRVDPARIADAITPKTVLVSVMWANNEVGTIQPMHEISAMCQQAGILLHSDAAQAVGKTPIDLCAIPVDLLSLSGHKVYGPQGIGALIVRQREPRIRIEPLFDGGGHEGRLRSGTIPLALAVGLGAACEIARAEMPVEIPRLRALALRLETGLTMLNDVILNGWPRRQNLPDEPRLAGNVHASFGGVDGTALLTSLREIAVSSGSACTSADPEPSHVLRAMGISEALSLASLRFGLGRDTTSEDIDFAITYISDNVLRLRQATAIRSGHGHQ